MSRLNVVAGRPSPVGWRALPVKEFEALATTRERLSRDDFFGEADGSAVQAAGADWRLTIYSIVDDGPHRWVQLAASGPTQRLAVVRLERPDTPEQLSRIVTDWLEHRADPSRVRSAG